MKVRKFIKQGKEILWQVYFNLSRTYIYEEAENMDITCDQSCDMGYIYLQKNNKDYMDIYDDRELLAANQPIEVIDNIYLKLNKLNWPDKKYRDALKDGDFIEEFQNDLDQDGYMKGIELRLTEERLKIIIENFKIATFELNNTQFNYLSFYPDQMTFDPENRVYALTEKEDVYVIVSKSEDRHYQITLGEGSSLTPKIAYVRALIFKDDSPYDIDYLKNLKLYKSTDDF